MGSLPSSVIYGTLPADAGFAMLETGEAVQRAQELRAIMACRTVGDVRAILPSLDWTPAPIDVDELEPGETAVADDEPFDWTDYMWGSEYTWPGSIQKRMLEWASQDLLDALGKRAGARIEDYEFDGPILEIPSNREHELLEVLDDFGIGHHRDDTMIGTTGIEGICDGYVASRGPKL